MAEGVYPLALEAFLKGEVDLLGDDIAVQLAEGSIDFDDGEEFLSDVSAVLLGAVETLTGKAVTGGTFTADYVLGHTVAGGDDVGCLYGFVDTGSAATSRLLFRMDRRGDHSPFVFTGDGSTVDLRWNVSGIFSI